MSLFNVRVMFYGQQQWITVPQPVELEHVEVNRYILTLHPLTSGLPYHYEAWRTATVEINGDVALSAHPIDRHAPDIFKSNVLRLDIAMPMRNPEDPQRDKPSSNPEDKR